MAFSASDAAFEGFRVARRAPMAIVLWGVLYLVLTVLMLALVGGSMAMVIQEASALETMGEPSAEAMAPLLMAYASMMGVMFPLSLVFGAVMNAAVNRAVLRPEEKAFGYLRLGGDELRVLVVSFVLSIIFVLLAVVLFGAVGVTVGVLTATVSESAGAISALVGFLLAFCVFIWLVVRLSLALPITVAEKRIAIFDSWNVTKGHFWGLLGMALLAFILTMVVSALLWTVFTVAMLAMGGGLADLEGAALEGAELMEVLSALGPIAVLAAILLALMSALELVILYAPFAAAYRDLRGGGAPAAVAETPAAADPAI